MNDVELQFGWQGLRYLFVSVTPGLRSASTASLGVFLMFLRRLGRPILWVLFLLWEFVVAREY